MGLHMPSPSANSAYVVPAQDSTELEVGPMIPSSIFSLFTGSEAHAQPTQGRVNQGRELGRKF